MQRQSPNTQSPDVKPAELNAAEQLNVNLDLPPLSPISIDPVGSPPSPEKVESPAGDWTMVDSQILSNEKSDVPSPKEILKPEPPLELKQEPEEVSAQDMQFSLTSKAEEKPEEAPQPNVLLQTQYDELKKQHEKLKAHYQELEQLYEAHSRYISSFEENAKLLQDRAKKDDQFILFFLTQAADFELQIKLLQEKIQEAESTIQNLQNASHKAQEELKKEKTEKSDFIQRFNEQFATLETFIAKQKGYQDTVEILEKNHLEEKAKLELQLKDLQKRQDEEKGKLDQQIKNNESIIGNLKSVYQASQNSLEKEKKEKSDFIKKFDEQFKTVESFIVNQNRFQYTVEISEKNHLEEKAKLELQLKDLQKRHGKEKAELQKKIDDLEQQLLKEKETLQLQINNLKQSLKEKEVLQLKLDNLQKRSDEEKEQSQQKLYDLEKKSNEEKAQLRQQLSDLEKNSNEKKENLEKIINNFEYLTTKAKTEWNEELNQSLKEKQQLEEKITHMSKEKINSDEQLKILRELLNNKQEEINILEERNEQQKAKALGIIAHQQQETNYVHASIAFYHAAYAQQQDQVRLKKQEQEQEITTIQQKFQGVVQTLRTEHNLHNENIKKLNATHEHEISLLQEQISKLKENHGDYIISQEKDIDRLKATHSNEIAMRDKQIESYLAIHKEEKSTLQTKIENLQMQLADVRTQHEKDLTEQDNTIEELKARLVILKNDRESLQQKFNSQILQHQNDTRRLTENHDKEIESLQTKKSKLHPRKKDLQKENVRLRLKQVVTKNEENSVLQEEKASKIAREKDSQPHRLKKLKSKNRHNSPQSSIQSSHAAIAHTINQTKLSYSQIASGISSITPIILPKRIEPQPKVMSGASLMYRRKESSQPNTGINSSNSDNGPKNDTPSARVGR